MEGVQPLHSSLVMTEASSEGQSVAEDSPRPRHFFKLDPLKTIDHSVNYMPPALEEDFIPAGYNEDKYIAAENEVANLIVVDHQIRETLFNADPTEIETNYYKAVQMQKEPEQIPSSVLLQQRRQGDRTPRCDVDLGYYLDSGHSKSTGFALRDYNIRVYDPFRPSFLNPTESVLNREGYTHYSHIANCDENLQSDNPLILWKNKGVHAGERLASLTDLIQTEADAYLSLIHI